MSRCPIGCGVVFEVLSRGQQASATLSSQTGMIVVNNKTVERENSLRTLMILETR